MTPYTEMKLKDDTTSNSSSAMSSSSLISTFNTTKKEETSPEKKVPDDKTKSSSKELPLAIQQLKQLQGKPISRAFSDHLKLFGTPKERRLNIFTEGVLLFTKIANLSSKERADYYGSEFSGLHYNNDLAKLCNLSSCQPIEAHQLSHICPPEWDYALKDGNFCLIYRGTDLSTALDKLLQGPTVIDCSMFCQLSIWFGIKYMLGNKTFNEIFGHTPCYLTQFSYGSSPPEEPYKGNPLYPFFEINTSEKTSGDTVSIVYVPNHKLYPLKHPGGNSSGQNCIVMSNKFTIFGPTLEKTSDLSRSDIEQLLLDKFNAKQNINDENRLELYKKHKDSIHTRLGKSFGSLIKEAESLSGFVAKSIELDNVMNRPFIFQNIGFNFEKFCSWVEGIQNSQKPISHTIVDYKPLSDDKLVLPKTLVQQIPYENRNRMSFSNFTVESPLQKEMLAISQKFCLDVMSGRSICVILTGKAGVGKTASAVSCAKELSSRKKNVVWVSEVMVRKWTDKATTPEELEICRTKIQKLLASKPDVVFLDDDNLVDYSGRVLLEEIYRWYTTTSGTGLFITSNEPVTFENCYGLKLDGYHFPPFPGYCSPQYKNRILRLGIIGQSMRLRPSLDIMKLSDPEKITALTSYRHSASVGIIIDAKSYDDEFDNAEFIPAIKDKDLCSIRFSLQEKKVEGPAYDALTSTQKKWLIRFQDGGHYVFGGYHSEYIRPYSSIRVKPFRESTSDILIVELLDRRTNSRKEKIIDEDCLNQLIRVINYAHDCGGKKIVLLNNTKFSQTTLLEKIKEGIPGREKERTLARIDALLLSPELKVTALLSNNEHTLPQVISPRELFFSSNIMQKFYETLLIENRHQSRKLQDEYDKQFGLELRMK